MEREQGGGWWNLCCGSLFGNPSGVGVQERLLTRESILGTWPVLGSPSTGRRQKRTLDRGPGTHHLLLTFLPLPTNSHLHDLFQQKLEVSIILELSFFSQNTEEIRAVETKKEEEKEKPTTIQDDYLNLGEFIPNHFLCFHFFV